MKKIVLGISGMSCSACSNGLEKHLNKQEGIENASVNLVMANAMIEYDESILNQKKIEAFVKEAGFKSTGIYNANDEENTNKKAKTLFITFGVLAIALIYISMGNMIGLPSIPGLDMTDYPERYSVVMLILTVAFIIYGFDIMKSGYRNLIHKAPNMDTLVAIGVCASFIYSIYAMCMVFAGHHHYVHNLYFESAAIVIFFIKLGRYIDSISKGKTREAIKKLVQITPNSAVVKIDGVEKQVTIDEIHKGDIIVSRAGEKIAVDGEVTYGTAHIDESFVTGESKPVNKAISDKVIAGSMNYDGYLEYKAEKIGKESTISEIVRLVVEATNTKMPIAKIADTVSGYFVPIVIVIAIVSFLTYVLLGLGVNVAIKTFVTVLVVACPCSLGLATPLAIVVSEGKCAENGILIKKSETLEIAEKVNVIIFDKTGTLTYGNLKISKIFNYSELSDDKLLEIAGSVEAKSTHPISKAFENILNENNIEMSAVDDFKNISGYGVTGIVDGRKIIIGNSKILEMFNIENCHTDDEKQLAKEGNSIVYVADEKIVLGIIGVNDLVRDDAYAAIENLKKKNIEIVMLTGDNNDTARLIAEKLGIENVISNVLPKEKLNVIKKLKDENKIVMMCGDGINDSPALANADIGVSVNSGTDIAMDSSDVVLVKDNLNRVVDLINISHKTIRNIKQNLFWAFFYNSLMIPIAVGLLGWAGITINPMIAGFAMVISSLTVILNALRLKNIKLT